MQASSSVLGLLGTRWIAMAEQEVVMAAMVERDHKGGHTMEPESYSEQRR